MLLYGVFPRCVINLVILLLFLCLLALLVITLSIEDRRINYPGARVACASPLQNTGRVAN